MAKSKIQGYIVLDFETGGLPSKSKLAVLDVAATEIALVYVTPELEIVDKYSALIKPYNKTAEYSKIAAEVSGITKQLCEEEGLPLKKVVTEIIDFIKANQTGKAKPVMVGHNLIDFDSYFMENLFAVAGEDLYKYVSKKMVDTMDEAYKIYPENENYQLGTICRNFGIELTGAHRALPDTIANAELWIGMLEAYRGQNTGDGGSVEIPRKRYDEQMLY